MNMEKKMVSLKGAGGDIDKKQFIETLNHSSDKMFVILGLK